MINNNDPLYWHSISYNVDTFPVWNEIRDEASDAGKFYMDISYRLNPSRFISRNGEWSLPWPQDLVPGYEMPVYDPTFSKTFDEVTNERALEIKQRIAQGEKFAVMYSGGIDSTVIMSALIKNLTAEELSSVTVCSSIHSMTENPYFYEKFIHNKFNLIDSRTIKYDDLIGMGLTPITADEGDCIFGTIFGLTMYNNLEMLTKDLSDESKAHIRSLKYAVSDPSVHFTEYKDAILAHLNVPTDPYFAEALYDKIIKNIDTASVPIYSLHDFFWWMIFNIKYLNCAIRGSLYFNNTVEWRTCMDRIVNWFGHADYQRWSMVNNNNGMKIKKSLSSYKWVAKEYIYDLDKNDWYRNFKIKLESLFNLTNQQPGMLDIDRNTHPSFRVGLTKDYEMMYLNDPATQDYFKHHLATYKRDW